MTQHQTTMTEPTNQQKVLVSSGDPSIGPYYLVISGLPEYTKWQDLADFLRCKISPRIDVYVSLDGPKNTSGWIRVIGLEMFAQVESVLRECPFMGQHIIYHDPGYNYTNGFGAIAINGPFVKDQHLFVPMDVLSPVPSPCPIMTPAMGDMIWVWPQATPHGQAAAPSTAFQYSATPSSPSPLLPPTTWDLTFPRYPPGLPYQAAPYFHQQPSPYSPYHQIQPQTQPQILAPWFLQSPITPEIDQYQQFQLQQSYSQAQQQYEGLLKLIITWKVAQDFPTPPPQTPYVGAYTPPNIQTWAISPWGMPTAAQTAAPTATATRWSDRHRDSNKTTNKKLCITIHITLSSSQNDPCTMSCSPDTVIATFRNPHHALRAFQELSHLEHISVRFPYSSEDLGYLENSLMMRDCTHTHQTWNHHQQQQQQQQGYYNQHDHQGQHRDHYDTYSHTRWDNNTRQYERWTGTIIPTRSTSPRRRRKAARPPPQLLPPLPIQTQKYAPYTPPFPPPSQPQSQPQSVSTTTTTTETKTDHSGGDKPHIQGGGERRGSPAVLIVDGSSRRPTQEDPIQRQRSGAVGTSAGNASVLVVNGTVNNSNMSHNVGHTPG